VTGYRKLITMGLALGVVAVLVVTGHIKGEDATDAISWVVAAFAGGNAAEHIAGGIAARGP